MANIKITRSELKRLIQEGVKPIAEAWARKNEEIETNKQIKEMVREALGKALFETDRASNEEEKECVSCTNRAMPNSDQCEDCARMESFRKATLDSGQEEAIQEANNAKSKKPSVSKEKKKEVRKPDPGTLRKVPLNRGGYTKQGQYFGVGAPLWAFEIDGKLYHTRASDKASAMKKIADGTDNQ